MQHCIRCGTSIPEGRLFCDACSACVSTPLEETEVRRRVLPDRSKDRVLPTPKPAKKAEAAPAPQSLRRRTVAIVALSLCCALLLGGIGFGFYEWQFGSIHRERSRQLLVSEENARLNAEVDRLEDAVSLAEEEQRTLEDARQADARRLQRLENELSIYRMQTGDLETDLSAMEQENFQLLDELEEAAANQHSLNRQLEDLQMQLQTQETANAELRATVGYIYAQVAFVAQDGTGYYHRYGCTYCSAGDCLVRSVAEAQSQGSTPCPYCHEADDAQ